MMQSSSFSKEFPDSYVVNILSSVNRMGFNTSSCKILTSNLRVLKDLNVKLSLSCSTKLSSFLQRLINTIDNGEDPSSFDWSEIQQSIRSILSLLEETEKLRVVESVLYSQLDNTEDLLSKFENEEDVSVFCRHLDLLDLFLTYVGENNLTIFSEEIKMRYDGVFHRLLVIEDRRLLPYTLTLGLNYLKVTRNQKLLETALIDVTERSLTREDSVEVFVMILSFFIDSSMEGIKFVGYLVTNEFWRALKQCYNCDKSLHKHANHLLKFSVFNLRHETVEGVWNSEHSKNYQSWWKNYFIIAETLEEKQTHLVLPAFSLISALLDDPVVKIDAFWILILFQSALEHDSRTIRIRAFHLFLSKKQDLYRSVHFPILFRLFMNIVNDSALYRKLLKTNELYNFRDAIVDWIRFFESKREISFFESLFSALCRVKWSPIPLYYILDTFTQSRIRPCLKMEVIKELKNTISDVTRFHHIVIRAAIQCSFVKFVTMICRFESEDLMYLFDFINYFNDEECLLRGVQAWSVLRDYLISAVDIKLEHSVEKFIFEKLISQLECERRLSNRIILPMARYILLLHDSFNVLGGRSSLDIRIEEMILSFSSALRNPYLDTRSQDNYLLLLVGIYSSIRNNSQVETCYPLPNAAGTMEENSLPIFSYIIQRMYKSESNAELLDFYDFCLRKLDKCAKVWLKNSNSVSILNDWWSMSLSSWHSRKDSSAYCCTKILLWILENVDTENIFCRFRRINDINPILKGFIDGEQLSSHHMNCGTSNVAANYANTMWSILELSLKLNHANFLKYFEVTLFIDFVLNTLDWTRKENLSLVLKTLKHFLADEIPLKFEDKTLQLMNDSWKRVEEIHSTPYYNDCLKYWIEAFLQKSILSVQTYHPKIEQYVNVLLEMVADNGGQSFKYIIFALNEFDRVENLYQIFPPASDILIKMYCVTHADREDQRMEYRTEEHIRSKENEVSVNQIKKFDPDFSSESMRLKALNAILKLSKTGDDCLSICLKFSQFLIAVDKNCRKRYFNDSVIHRVKHKKLQLLLIIETIAFQRISSSNSNLLEIPKLLYDFAVGCLLIDPHQPSVRYMLEWLIVRLILHYPLHFSRIFWDSFSEASDERIGSICSFISIAFHVSNVSKNETFVNQAVKFILPWTMGQHFNARLYAQTVLVKLINTTDTLQKKYEIVEESLNNCLKKGNAVKNSIKLQQDFYFCSFHPINHFSLLMLLWDLPRLSGICREEWLPRNLFEKYLLVESDSLIPFYHVPDLFSSLSSSSWIAKAAAANHLNEHDGTSGTEISQVNLTETQKKFIPVESTSNIESPRLPERTRNLIVVASLIDRAPNLGGLTRTCEIFAVSQLAVNNLDVTRNKEFTSLSITAEKHVDLVEVKRHNLYDYLRKLREDEFCIIGVEQTTNSKKLERFVFPLKSVLVLGNEREGIPASLLPFLDVCVEIPQSGVIRSLNVHVSASILIWEYSKQHLLKPK